MSEKPEAAAGDSAIRAQQAERVALREVTARLKAAFPTAAPNTVEELVGTAYSELSHARVRTYLAILVERRVRKTLAVNDAAAEAVAAQ
ncbi:hypothetical protein FCH28_03425 [Streptomyces piniterrae]|uniref:DUF3562 domain-containing protein n=1 Tax=Streptomyces piniterrae TaxID=2571125 RepID=A0A4U0NWI5_9ACTN|nr:hypothetical protein [Streptomyces piniterrae]TJZ59166.1 hypothetical protein FCH28_03425 [Streptomyces piniterrae]